MSELKACLFECDNTPSPYYMSDCKLTGKLCRKEICKIFTKISDANKRISELEVERAKLRAALEKIAAKENPNCCFDPWTDYEEVLEIAREALKGVE